MAVERTENTGITSELDTSFDPSTLFRSNDKIFTSDTRLELDNEHVAYGKIITTVANQGTVETCGKVRLMDSIGTSLCPIKELKLTALNSLNSEIVTVDNRQDLHIYAETVNHSEVALYSSKHNIIIHCQNYVANNAAFYTGSYTIKIIAETMKFKGSVAVTKDCTYATHYVALDLSEVTQIDTSEVSAIMFRINGDTTTNGSVFRMLNAPETEFHAPLSIIGDTHWTTTGIYGQVVHSSDAD